MTLRRDMPADHHVWLYIGVDNDEPLLVGTAREVADVPHLLRAVAEHWHLRDSGGRLTLDDAGDYSPGS